MTKSATTRKVPIIGFSLADLLYEWNSHDRRPRVSEAEDRLTVITAMCGVWWGWRLPVWRVWRRCRPKEDWAGPGSTSRPPPSPVSRCGRGAGTQGSPHRTSRQTATPTSGLAQLVACNNDVDCSRSQARDGAVSPSFISVDRHSI